MDIRQLLESPPLARAQLAQRAGISRNTEWSLRHDQNRAQMGTLRELALACGLEIDVQVRAGFDPMAAAAARILIGDLQIEENPELDLWKERLLRYSKSSVIEPNRWQLVKEAAIFSGAQNAQGAILLAGRSDILRLTSAAMATNLVLQKTKPQTASGLSEHAWVLSGRVALPGQNPDELSRQEIPTVVWTSHPELFATQLQTSHRVVETARAANVIIAKISEHHLAGAIGLHNANKVSLDQAIIDCLGIGGASELAASELNGSW